MLFWVYDYWSLALRCNLICSVRCVGSSDPVPCPGGQFCQFDGLATPTDNCSAGYYCAARASTPTPTDGTTGNVCPAGYYCVAGASYPEPCSPGTYSGSQGNTAQTDCVLCSYGEYCQDYNLTMTTGNCSAGYYCPQGERTPNPYPCPIGHYCTEHTYDPFLCPSGTYQDYAGQWDCKICPEGYYCDNSVGVVNITDAIKCPAGFYCLSGKDLSPGIGICQFII